MHKINQKQIGPLLSGTTNAEKFIVMALAASLGEDGVESILAEMRGGRGIDINRRVLKMPLSHWLGKTEADVIREGLTGAQVEELAVAMKEAGSELPRTPQATTVATAATDTGEADEGSTEPTEAETAHADEGERTVYGYKIKDLAGLTDAQLTKKGVGKAGIASVRKYEDVALAGPDQPK